MAYVRRNFGSALQSAKRYDQAEAAYRQVVQTYQDLGDQVGEARTLVRLGNLDEDRQQWDAAIAWYEQARRLFEVLKQPANAADVTSNIGNVLKSAKRYDQAEAAYRQVVQTYQDLGDKSVKQGLSFDWAILTKTASSGIGHRLVRAGTPAVRSTQAAGQPAEVTSNIGDVLKAAKRYDQAEAAYRQVLQTYQDLGDQVGEAGTLVRLGNLDEDRQQWDAAIAWHEQARRVFEALKQPANAAVVTGNIGNVLKAAKRYDQAEAAYRQVVQTYQDLGDRAAEAGSLNRLGLLDEDRQQWDAAIAWYEQARRVFEALKQPANAAVVTGNIGDVLKAAKRYDQAERLTGRCCRPTRTWAIKSVKQGLSFDWAILTKTASSGMRPSSATCTPARSLIV